MINHVVEAICIATGSFSDNTERTTDCRTSLSFSSASFNRVAFSSWQLDMFSTLCEENNASSLVASMALGGGTGPEMLWGGDIDNS